MKKTTCTFLFLFVAVTCVCTLSGCGDGGPSGTIQPPKVDNTAVTGKIVERPSTDEK